MDRLRGRVAVITGAASGIGLATAECFAAEGAGIAGIDVGAPPEEAWARVEAAAPGASMQTADVRDEEAVQAAVAAAVERFGRIDVLVTAAGVIGAGPAHMLAVEEWDRIVDINLKGSFIAAKHVLPTMLEQGSGSIVLVASVEGHIGLAGHVAYNASKGGVVLMTRSMAIDYGPAGIRINCICPGGVETAMTNMLNLEGMESLRAQLEEFHVLGRFAQPGEIANAALFLASDESSFVTGSSLMVDGGYTAGHRLRPV